MEVGKGRRFELSRMIFCVLEIKIKFQSIPPDRDWSSEINPIQVKYQAISFPIPNFPWPINVPTKVNVLVQQGNTLLDTLVFSYIPQCNSKNLRRKFIRNSLLL